MTRHEKILRRVLSGAANQSLRFEDLCVLLRRLGFTERHRGGSHHVSSGEGVAEVLNLHPRAGGQAKAYQVRQVRELVVKYGFGSAFEREDSGEV